MLYTLVLLSILVGLLIFDFHRNRDILSPLVLVSAPLMLLYFVPAVLKMMLGHRLVYVPNEIDHGLVIEYTASYLFLTILSFGISYFIAQSFARKVRVPDFEIVFRNKFSFGTYLLLAFGSFFLMMTLMPHNWGGTDVYYNISGFGVVHWVVGVLIFNAPFLFLASPQHRWWCVPAVICNVVLIGYLLERSTSTAFLILSLMIVLRRVYSWSLKVQLWIFVGVPLALILRKFLMVYLSHPKTFVETASWFFIFELGRLDYLAGAIFYHLEGLKLEWMTALRYIPLATYLPYIRDLNDVFQALPEQLFVGRRISQLGGLPFTLQGEMILLFGPVGTFMLSSLWGMIFGFLYQFIKISLNPYVLGFYAIFIYSGRNMGLSFFGSLLPILIFLTLFCRIRLLGRSDAQQSE